MSSSANMLPSSRQSFSESDNAIRFASLGKGSGSKSQSCLGSMNDLLVRYEGTEVIIGSPGVGVFQEDRGETAGLASPEAEEIGEAPHEDALGAERSNPEEWPDSG